MKLTDLLPLDKWYELEKEISDRTGLTTNVFDTDGIRITDFHMWPNKLCPAVKATDKGQSFICAVAHMNLASQAVAEKTPILEECDAGLLKIVVPIIVDEEYVGAFGACGLLLDDGEVDSFLVNKITEIDEEEVERLSEGIGSISGEEADTLAGEIYNKVQKIIRDYENRKN